LLFRSWRNSAVDSGGLGDFHCWCQLNEGFRTHLIADGRNPAHTDFASIVGHSMSKHTVRADTKQIPVSNPYLDLPERFRLEVQIETTVSMSRSIYPEK
jgi:hypothetical protein